jgi:NADPH:quinone reductase
MAWAITSFSARRLTGAPDRLQARTAPLRAAAERPPTPPAGEALAKQAAALHDAPMPHALRLHQPGSPEALTWEEVPAAEPGPGQVLLRHHAVGLNFIDVYHRTGLYPLPLPAVIGQEAAGEVLALGPGVLGIAVGDRVGYATALGAYCQERVIHADKLVPLPQTISYEVAAASLLKGLTAQYLLRRTFPVKPGTRILVHAAAGGVGLLLCQWAKALGATVFGTAGSEEKAARARQAGCERVFVYTREDFVQGVRGALGGDGVDVVYDAVGQATFAGSLDCLRPLGMMVSFGQASGPVPPLDVLTLSAKGSLFLTRPTLGSYAARREELLAMAAELFAAIDAGHVQVSVGQRFPLAQAAQAHRALQARGTVGATLLLP